MRFEHLVQINDPLMPLLDPLSREQLWRGLVRRAEDPVPFVLGLDECRILDRGENYLKRELRFGAVHFVDHVRLDPPDAVRYESDAGGLHAGSSLTVTIEEPGPDVLFVRFRYETLGTDSAPGDDPRYDEARRSAYRESDIDTIRKIREYAANGLLG